MRQVLQSLNDGTVEVASVPCPVAAPGHVLIATSRSLISSGTERMLVDFGKAGLIQKARQQPEKVRMVLDKIRTDGLVQTVRAVRAKLDEPMPLGYCNVGRAVEIGAGVADFRVGDRVVCNGRHAEYVAVPANLCARIPDDVSDDDAVFTILAAIALQGVRLVRPTLGEAVAVMGLGLVGVLAVQLLRAHGCRVLGTDLDPSRVERAREFGVEAIVAGAAEDVLARAKTFSRGAGMDAVVVATATQSSDPIHQAATMCRKRGRIVLVGVAGLELSRADFYEKEVTFQVSCSYGPGRYDPEYEQKGRDYPFAFVRWTERRNFEAVLDMLAEGRVKFAPLVSHRIPFNEAQRGYEVLSGKEPHFGILLEYAQPAEAPTAAHRAIHIAARRPAAVPGTPVIGVIGAGAYANAVLIPAFARTGARLKSVASAGGVTAARIARKFSFEQAATDADAILTDSDIDTVIVCTRHDTHAEFVRRALRADKHVFVEKPLALTTAQLDQVDSAYTRQTDAGRRVLMVGFNRRFAPHVAKMKALLDRTAGPKSYAVTVNAGAIPKEHWTQDLEVGGGRIVGEACHFIDLLRFMAGAPIKRLHTSRLTYGAGAPSDTATIQIEFAEGSIGTIHYFAEGHRSFPKERIEVFAAGRILQLDNFRVLTGYGWPGFRRMRSWRQDKGQAACASAFVDAIRTGRGSPIAFEELMEVSRATIEAAAMNR